MHNLSLKVSDEAYSHLMYFISNIKDDIEIVKDEILELSDIEILDNFREGLKELKSLKDSSNSNLKTIEEFLDEL
jgi:archaellum component FlaC